MDSQRRKVFYLLLLYMFGLSASEGSFEDADKSNDFLSQSHQHFDLRHTIPGEPDKDYPIYSVVPKTSFSCAQKHEGYYADIESRCQAFRICTNTARHTAGFGFLCPNGTLFSQRHFVCDWYRNVRCEESEQFYNKNAHNRITNHYEMMETVRQMIEYPMKTISKALSQKPVHTKTQQPSRSYTTQMKTEPQPTVVSFTQTYPSVARHSHQSTNLLSSSMVPTTAKALRGEAVQSLPVTKNTQEIYVNSFGELSTDPGSKFDLKTARIIAKPQKPGRALNFAESINFGLNEYFPAGNRNQKSNKNVGDVSDNFNILRHEIQADLSAKKSVHRSTSNQESSAHSNFISHGFSKNRKNYEKSPNFQFSKPLGSTTKYSSNDFSIDTQNTLNVEFKFMNTTQSTPVTVDSFLINSFFDFPNEPLADDFETVNADEVEEILFQDTTETKTKDNDVIKVKFNSTTVKPTTTPVTSTTNRPITTTTVELIDTTIPETTESVTVESLPLIMKVNNDIIEKANSSDESLYLIPDLNLVENVIDSEEITPKTLTTTTTTSSTPLTDGTQMMQTSTEMIMSIKSVETHVRSHKRPHLSRNQARPTTTKIPYIRRRPQLRGNLTTTTTTTTPRNNEHPTLVKERRHHHHHHHSHHSHRSHHSRQRARTTTTTTTTTVAPNLELNIASEVSEYDSSRKLNVRNIESTSVARGNSLSADKNTKASLRFNNPHRRTTTTTTITSTTTRPTNARNRQNIIRSRGSQTYQRASRTTSTTTTTRATTTKKPSSIVENIIGKSIEIIPFNVSLIHSTDSTTTTSTTTLAPTITPSSSTTSILNISNTLNITDTIVDTLLPFNELTRAIVDESILQNYRTNQKIQQQQPIVQKQLFKPTPATKSHTFATKPAASNNVFPQDIVIARAEGERIVTTNQTPQTKLNKVSSATNYESLNEFLNKKFGQTQTQAKPTTSYYSTPQQQQQQNNQYNVQQRQQSTHFPINVQQQQQTKHIVYAQPAHHQQIYSQNSIFRTLQQQQQTQQQQQHTYFNNNNQLTLNSQLNNFRQPQPQQQQQIGSYRNLKLPTLNDGIIPAAYTQVAAQRRLDTFNFELETSTLPRMKLFSGVSSYDVPLSSVGRLPNDISQRLRRL